MSVIHSAFTEFFDIQLIPNPHKNGHNNFTYDKTVIVADMTAVFIVKFKTAHITDIISVIILMM